MTRLRYSLAEAEIAATDIARNVICRAQSTQTARLVSIRPDGRVNQGTSSKHPTRWIAMFVWHDLDIVQDGGETLVAVDLENQTGEILTL